jgi:hypothetical protein
MRSKSIKLDEFEKSLSVTLNKLICQGFSYDKVDTSRESTLNSELSNLEIDEKNCINDIDA